LLLILALAFANFSVMKTFKGYWEGLSPADKTKLAENAETSICYLSQVAHGHRRAGISLIMRLRQADEEISLEMMRQDLSRTAA